MKITKTKTGKFTTVVRVGKDLNGNYKIKRFTAGSRAELTSQVSEYLANSKQLVDSHALGMAFARYIANREGKRSPATIRGYETVRLELEKRHNLLMAKTTDAITRSDLQAVADHLVQRGRSPKTIVNYISLIGSVMEEDGIRPPKVILPERKRYDAMCPSETEMKMLLVLLHNHPLEVPVHLAILGLRRGEICALLPEDLNDGNVLHIHRSAVYDHDGFPHIKETPKTAESNRFVQISPFIADRIRSSGYITRYSPAGLSEAFRYFLDKYRFPHYRLHDCRHFFASYCHAHGISEADILAIGGWRTNNIMRSVYRHSMAKNAASNAIIDFTGG